MAFYDANAAIDKPNVLNAWRQGQAIGQQQRAYQQQQQDQNALRELAPQIINGDPGALAQGAAIDPEAATKYQAVGDTQMKRLGGAINYIEQLQKTGDPRVLEAAYQQQIRPYLASFGQEPPATFAEAEPKFMEAKARIAMAQAGGAQSAVQSTYIDAQGNRVAILRDGTTQVLGQNAPNTQLVDITNPDGTIDKFGVDRNRNDLEARQVLVGGQTQQPQSQPAQAAQVAGAGGRLTDDQIGAQATQMIQQGTPEADVDAWVQQQLGQSRDVTPAQRGGFQSQTGRPLRSAQKPPSEIEQQRLALAQDANQRAAEASRRADQSFEMQQRGNAPAGFRFKPDGSLERIPGGPKLEVDTNRDRDASATIDLLDRAEPLIQQSTGSTLGNLVDRGAAMTGSSTGGAKAIASLQTLAGQLTSKMPRMQGPQSDRDVEMYKQMAGDLANPTIPRETRIAALNTIRALNEKYTDGGGKQQQAARIQSAADYDALPSGATFIAPDGTQRRKR